MPNANQIPNGSKAMGYYLIAIVVLVLDQISKYYFEFAFEEGDTVSVIEPVLNWTLAYNRGAAFSFLADQAGWQKWFFAILGLAVSGFIIAYLRKVPKSASVLSLGLAMVLGGAVGNVIDRIRFGGVVDFQDFSGLMFPRVFNVADRAISVGVVLGGTVVPPRRVIR